MCSSDLPSGPEGDNRRDVQGKAGRTGGVREVQAEVIGGRGTSGLLVPLREITLPTPLRLRRRPAEHAVSDEHAYRIERDADARHHDLNYL